MRGEERTLGTQCASISLLTRSGERNNLEGAVARKATKKIRSYCQSADLKGSAITTAPAAAGGRCALAAAGAESAAAGEERAGVVVGGEAARGPALPL